LVEVSGHEVRPKTFPAQVVYRNLAVSSRVCYGQVRRLLDRLEEVSAAPRIVERGAAT